MQASLLRKRHKTQTQIHTHSDTHTHARTCGQYCTARRSNDSTLPLLPWAISSFCSERDTGTHTHNLHTHTNTHTHTPVGSTAPHAVAMTLQCLCCRGPSPVGQLLSKFAPCLGRFPAPWRTAYVLPVCERVYVCVVSVCVLSVCVCACVILA